FGNGPAPRVAKPAGLDLLAQHARGCAVRRVPGRRIDGPAGVLALVESDDEAFGVGVRPLRAPARMPSRPGDMGRTLPVACLAADADLGESRGETVLGRVVVLMHAGRVTLGAHEIPVLVELRPVQDVVEADLLVRIEVKPALSALVLRPAVPAERQRLDAAVGKLHEILLERIDAERVFDREFGELPVRPVGLDHELAVAPEKARLDPEMLEARV